MLAKFEPNSWIIEYSIKPAAKSSAITIPISIPVLRSSIPSGFFLTIALIRRKLLDIPIEYATISITPKGEKNMRARGGSLESIGVVEIRALKATPVEYAAKDPHAMPNPGTNIGKATDALSAKIPNASIPSTAL